MTTFNKLRLTKQIFQKKLLETFENVKLYFKPPVSKEQYLGSIYFIIAVIIKSRMHKAFAYLLIFCQVVIILDFIVYLLVFKWELRLIFEKGPLLFGCGYVSQEIMLKKWLKNCLFQTGVILIIYIYYGKEILNNYSETFDECTRKYPPNQTTHEFILSKNKIFYRITYLAFIYTIATAFSLGTWNGYKIHFFINQLNYWHLNHWSLRVCYNGIIIYLALITTTSSLVFAVCIQSIRYQFFILADNLLLISTSEVENKNIELDENLQDFILQHIKYCIYHYQLLQRFFK